MAFPLLGNPKPAFFDSSGSPLVSGTLAILDPDDDTNKASYPTLADADALTNANDNPLTLDSRGEPEDGLFGLSGNSYKLVLKDSDATTVWTVAKLTLPISAINQSWTASVPSAALSFSETIATISDSTQAFSRDTTIVEDFTLDANASATAANNNAVLAALIGYLQGKGMIE